MASAGLRAFLSRSHRLKAACTVRPPHTTASLWVLAPPPPWSSSLPRGDGGWRYNCERATSAESLPPSSLPSAVGNFFNFRSWFCRNRNTRRRHASASAQSPDSPSSTKQAPKSAQLCTVSGWLLPSMASAARKPFRNRSAAPSNPRPPESPRCLAMSARRVVESGTVRWFGTGTKACGECTKAFSSFSKAAPSSLELAAHEERAQSVFPSMEASDEQVVIICALTSRCGVSIASSMMI
mmetsp:Transcript_18891/g.38941  ORF Transcript_18891/g.38941 Transcript_18891/m.38941 type:complete len:239 (+) Transcript_18891:684-1400(+)